MNKNDADGVLSTLGYREAIVFFKILVRAGPSNVMLVTLLIPVTALVNGKVFLGESIEAKEIVGAIIIGSGLFFIDARVSLSLFANLPNSAIRWTAKAGVSATAPQLTKISPNESTLARTATVRL